MGDLGRSSCFDFFGLMKEVCFGAGFLDKASFVDIVF
jgi:hypothetical protein